MNYTVAIITAGVLIALAIIVQSVVMYLIIKMLNRS